MRYYLFIFFVIISNYGPTRCQSNSITEFLPLKCSGTIPDDFRQLTRQKIRNDIEKEQVSTDAYLNKLKKDFFLQSNYIINDLLLGGSVLFGDTVTKYVNEIADEILKDETELRKKLRFYCIKTTEVNAFTTNQGIVFISLGLLSKLENEAQLAYVLCHEIIHFKNKHVINTFMKNDELFSSNKQGKISNFEKLKLISSYSKDLETEADTAGYALFRKSKYSKIEAYNSLKVLQFSHLPFGEFEFTTTFLENNLMHLPEKYKTDKLHEIDQNSDQYDDMLSSHPNIRKRKELIYSVYMKDTTKLNDNITNTDKFNFINSICKYEVLHLYLLNHKYIDALYNSSFLLIKNENNEYLESCLGKSMYGLTKYSNYNRLGQVNRVSDYSEGNIYKAHFFIKELTKVELNTISAGYLFHLTQRYPGNKFLHTLCYDLIKDLVLLHSLIPLHFKNESIKMQKNINEINFRKSEVSDSLISIDSIKINIQPEKPDIINFHLLSFGNYVDSVKLINIFTEIVKKNNEKIRLSEDKQLVMAKWSESDRVKYDNKENSKVKNTDSTIESIVFVSPFYFLADERNGLKLLSSERKLLNFNKQIKKCSKKAKIKGVLLSPYEYEETDIEKYNEIAFINDWFEENRNINDLQMVPLQTEYITNISKKYNCSNFSQTGILNYKKKKEYIGPILFYSVLYFPLLPIAIPYVLTPDYYTYYYTSIYNIETGEPISQNQTLIRAGKNYSYINSIMYDYFLKLRK